MKKRRGQAPLPDFFYCLTDLDPSYKKKSKIEQVRKRGLPPLSVGWNQTSRMDVSSLMYCPQCGTESQSTQYCRICGANLKVIGKAVALSEAVARSDRGPLPKIKEMIKEFKVDHVQDEVSGALDRMNQEIANISPESQPREPRRPWV